MNYRLESDPPAQTGRVVLRKAASLSKLLSWCLFVVGLACLGLGVVRMFSSPSWMISSLGAGAGFVLLGMGSQVLQWVRGPLRFVFDNESGDLIVEEREGLSGVTRTALPYAQIEGFFVTQHLASDEGEHRIFYATSMLKNDGASWRFLSTSDESKAQALRDDLRRLVSLARPDEAPPSTYPAGSIEVDEQTDKTIVRWDRPHAFFQAAPFALSSLGFLLALFGVRQLMPPTPFYLLAGLMGLLVLCSLVWALLSLNKHVVLEITEQQVTSYEEGAWGGNSRFSIPTEEIDAILFNFHPEEQNSIFLLRPQERALMNKINQGSSSLQELLMALRLKLSVTRLPAEDLSVGEKLHLEQLLQHLLFSRSGKQAL